MYDVQNDVQPQKSGKMSENALLREMKKVRWDRTFFGGSPGKTRTYNPSVNRSPKRYQTKPKKIAKNTDKQALFGTLFVFHLKNWVPKNSRNFTPYDLVNDVRFLLQNRPKIGLYMQTRSFQNTVEVSYTKTNKPLFDDLISSNEDFSLSHKKHCGIARNTV